MLPVPKRRRSSNLTNSLGNVTKSSKSMRKAQQKPSIIKTIFLGSPHTGKDALIVRYKSGVFIDNQEAFDASFGLKPRKQKGIKTKQTKSKSPRQPNSSESKISTVKRGHSFSPDHIEIPTERESPSAFGFLALLEAPEQEKFKELSSKAISPSYIMELALQKTKYKWKLSKGYSLMDIEIKNYESIVFVFSLCNVASFHEAKQNILQYHKHVCEEERRVLLLVGTFNELAAEVSETWITEICQKYSILYYSCSAKTKRGVNHIFNSLKSQLNFKLQYYDKWKINQLSLKGKFIVPLLQNDLKSLLYMYHNFVGQKPSFLMKNGYTMVHVAAWMNFMDAFPLFIQYEPTCIHEKDENGCTPLHIASRMGHLDLVSFLLLEGADVNVQDNEKKKATTTGYYRIKNLLKQHQMDMKVNESLKERAGKKSELGFVSKTSRISGVNLKVSDNFLTSLNLSQSGLLRIPEEVLNCEGLLHLNLSYNDIKNLAIDFSQMKSLKEMILHHNEIASMPEEITRLRTLELLDFRCNHLAGISPCIHNLTALKSLLASHNMLMHLPSQIAELPALEILDIYNNPLSSVPRDVLPQVGERTVSFLAPLFAYLRDISIGGQREYNRVKIMFVGDGNVGKTSLLNCILEKSKGKHKTLHAGTDPTDTIATDGIDINQLEFDVPKQGVGVHSKKEKGGKMIWDCWDYAGQEVYYSTHQFFLSPRSVYLVCFNMLDRDLSKVEYWINSVHSRARGSPIFLIGTHIDDKECTDDYVREYIDVLLEKIKPDRFVDKNGVGSIKGIHALSSRKRTGINELIADISASIVSCGFVGKLFPSSWITLEETLQKLKSSVPFLEWTEFEGIAKSSQIEKASITEAANFFHLAGSLCYFGDSQDSLRDLVVLDPQYLADIMSSVVTLKHSFGSSGSLTKIDFAQVWKAFHPSIHNTLIDLLMRFDILYKIPGEEGKYVAPCLLPHARPLLPDWNISLNRKFDGLVFNRMYQFSFLPLGFFPRLMARNYYLPGLLSKASWQYGQLLAGEGVTALFTYNPTSFALQLQVHAPLADINTKQYNEAVRILRILIECIETTIEGWYECSTKIFIPCSHCISEGGYNQWNFPVDLCMEAIAANRPYVLCHNVRKIRLDILAPDISLADLDSLKIDPDEIEFEEDIAEGTFGAVFRASYRGKTVAVKELLENEVSPHSSLGSCESGSRKSSEQEELVTMFSEFKREVWLLHALHHPNVCSLIGICLSPMAIVMEYLPLGDLFRLIGDIRESNRSLTELLGQMKVKLRLCYDIAKGMCHLHSFDPPVIHRDLRSPNVFITSLTYDAPVCALVGDFGLSRVTGASLAGGAFNKNWLAPEVMKGENYSEKMDIYSFAIVCWEILSLGRPFVEFNETFSVLPKAEFEKAVIGGLRPTIPPETPALYIKLLETCWATEPAERPDFPAIICILEILMKEFHVPIPLSSIPLITETLLDFDEGSEEERFLLGPQSNADVVRLQHIISLPQSDSVQAMIKVGDFIWCGLAGGNVLVYDSDFLLWKRIEVTTDTICSLCYAGDTIWIGCSSGKIITMAQDGRRLTTYKEHDCAVRALTYIAPLTINSPLSKKGAVIWSGDIAGNIFIWKIKKGKAKMKSKLSIGGSIGCFHQYLQYVLIGGDKDIFFMDSSGALLGVWEGHKSLVNCIISNHQHIWSCSNDCSVLVWKPQFGNNIPVCSPLIAHSARVFCLLSLEKFVVSGSFDKTVAIWDPNSFELVQELRNHVDGIQCLVQASNTTFWSGSLEGDSSVVVWAFNKATPQLHRSLSLT